MQQFVTPEGVHIIIMPLLEGAEQMLAKVPHSESDREKMACLGNERRRQEFAGVRLLLFRALGESKELLHNENGKPYLADGSLQISISHTRGYVCLSWHPVLISGVDVEQIGTRMERLQSRFLSQKELASLHDDDGKHTKAHLCWSAKESVYKIVGKKTVDFQNNIETEPFLLKTQGLFSAYVLPEKWKIPVYYWHTNDYVMTLAIAKPDDECVRYHID